MKRILAIAVALFAFALPARAEEPTKKFFLEDDGSVTRRFEKVESDVQALKARVAALEAISREKTAAAADVFKMKPIVNPLTPAAPAAPAKATQFKTVRMQTCTNGVCRVEYVQVPVDDTTFTGTVSAGNPCPMGQCTDCQCASMSGSGTSTRTGWYLGKRLGR